MLDRLLPAYAIYAGAFIAALPVALLIDDASVFVATAAIAALVTLAALIARR